MICPACGAGNGESDRFCSTCRAPLHVAPESGDRSGPPLSGRPVLGGRFQVIRSLGKGGMGEIFLAQDMKLERKVAIKSISAAAICDRDSKTRFLREAQAASRLDHANICTIYEIAEEDGREFIVMQYIDGVTLDQLLKLKPLSLEQVVDIAQQIADGMAAAQGRHIVHRDIKPGNIMIDRNGQVKILDFGLAKICAGPGQGEGGADPDATADAERHDRDLTEKGIVLGTVSYMSPEQAKGLKLDGRSDIFSYGLVLYEMLESRNPFSDDENIVTLYNILHRDVQFNRPAPEALRRIVRQCLQKDRGRRFGDFDEIRRELAALKAEMAAAKRSPAGKETEIIDVREQSELLRLSDRRGPASDSERLSEMVRRLKSMKASTEALRMSGRRWRIAIALLLPAAAAILWLLVLRPGEPAGGTAKTGPTAVRVLLYPFENQTADARIGAEIDFLIQEALNQSPGCETLPAATVRELEGGGEISAGRLPALAEKYGIRYVLRGKLSSVADKFNIEASLDRVGERDGHAPFFIPGKEKDSLLSDQVDNLARRVRMSVGNSATGDGEPARIAAMYGGDWRAFDLFFQGMVQWDKKQFGNARRLLLNADTLAGGLPAARYHLALLADYTGAAGEAQEHVRALIPLLPRFSLPLRLKVQALRAKFDFDFREQVRCLRELKGMFPFSKERIFELGEAYFRHGDAKRAIPEYDAALALDRNYAAALNHLGYCYSYLGRHQQAIECFERYRDIDRTANSFDSLGDGYFYLGDYTQAENSKIYAVSLDDSMDWPYLTIADINILRADLGEAGKSLQNYQKLASYPKAQADALAKKAFMRYLEGDHAAALELLGQALRRHDSTSISEHSAESHWLAGLCRVVQGDLPGAARELRWLQGLRDTYHLTADNFDAALKFCLHLEARIAEAEQQPEKADKLYRELLAMKTQLSFWITYFNYPFFLNEYAEFLLRRHDLANAGAALDLCLAFNPDYPPALWTKASLLKAQGSRGYLDVLRHIAAIYGPGGERNRWRDRLAAELSK
jgi:serine/threonine protein kinase/tetratricopeptide (TPR) repeat protein